MPLRNLASFLFAVCLLLPASARALLINGGAELGDLTGWTLTPAGAPADATTSRSQASGTVLPIQGDWFFTFANGSHPGPITLTQTGTTGLDADGLKLTGSVQTEFDDPAVVVLSVLDGSGGVLASTTTGFVTTPNLTWQALPTLTLAIPTGAASWSVELRGELNFGSFINTHFDGIRLRAIPEPTTAALVGCGLCLFALRRRRGSMSLRAEL